MNKTTIFISHITEEKAIATSFKDFLENQFLGTIDVFASSHEESIKLGDDWMGRIKLSIQHCKLILVICSPISIKRPWIFFEAGSGWGKDIPVIPLCHSGITPEKLPVPLNSFQGGLINKPEDIKKVFKRIAEILNIKEPNSAIDDFYSNLNNLESKILHSELKKDITFISEFLSRKIHLLKRSIYESTSNDLYFNKIDLEDDMTNYDFTFNDIYRLYYPCNLLRFANKKNYQVYFDSINELVENIKFLLIYSDITIPEYIKNHLKTFIFYSTDAIEIYNEIRAWDDGKNKYDEQSIKNEPLPPTYKYSNGINKFIDYYKSLLYYKNWIIGYEKYIKEIIT